MSENIYLVASAGNPNYGDELIVGAWLRFLAQTRPDATIWLDCPHPGTASALFAGIHPHFVATNTLWRSCMESPDQSAAAVWNHVDKVLREGGTPMYDVALMKLGQASVIHMLGGGYVNGVWADHVGLVSGMNTARILNGTILYGSGLGLMPPPPNAEDLREAFSRFDYITVRDSESARIFDIRVGLDDVFLGLLAELKRAAETRQVQSRAKDVMLCVQSDMTSESHFEHIARMMKITVKRAIEDGKSVGYVEAIPGSDRRMFDALEGLIPEENFVPFVHVWHDGLPVREGQEWYTSRFHLHLVAAAAGATGVAIGIQDSYYDIKHRSLLNLGTGWSYASAQTAEELPFPGGNAGFSAKALRLAAVKRSEALRLYPPTH